MDCNLLTDGNVHNRVPSPLPHVIVKNIFLFSIPLSLSLSFSVYPYRPIQSLLTMVGAGCLVLSRSLSISLSVKHTRHTHAGIWKAERTPPPPGPPSWKMLLRHVLSVLKIHILSTMSSSSSSPFFKPAKVFSHTGRDSNSSGKRRPFALFFSSVLHIFASLSVSFNNISHICCPGACGARVDIRHSPSDLALNYPATSLTKNTNKHFLLSLCLSVSTVEPLAIRYFSYLSSTFGVLVNLVFLSASSSSEYREKEVQLERTPHPYQQ